jgi:hypothetical protein
MQGTDRINLIGVAANGNRGNFDKVLRRSRRLVDLERKGLGAAQRPPAGLQAKEYNCCQKYTHWTLSGTRCLERIILPKICAGTRRNRKKAPFGAFLLWSLPGLAQFDIAGLVQLFSAIAKDRRDAGALYCDTLQPSNRCDLYVVTLAGPVHVDYGDWIVRGVEHELYPCTADIFDATYEPVEASDG